MSVRLVNKGCRGAFDSLDLVVPRDEASHRLTYWIDRRGALPGGISRDSATYYFGSHEDAEGFQQAEGLYAGTPFIGEYVVTASEIRKMDGAE